MAEETLSLRVSANSQQAVAALTRLNETMSLMSRNLQRVAENTAPVARGLSQAEKAAKGLADREAGLRKLTGALEGLRGVGLGLTAAFAGVATAMGVIAKSGVDMNVTLQQTTLALTQITGSSAGAARLLGDLRKEALSSKLEFKEMLPPAQSLAAALTQAYGAAGLGKVITTMRAFGDAATGLGVSKDAQARALLGYRQLLARGRPSQEDLNQIIENLPGFNVSGILLKKFGTADTEALQRAHVTGAQIADALVAGMQKQFGGAQKRLAGTLPMILSNFGDAFNEFSSRLTSNFTPQITKALDGLQKSFVALTRDASAMSALREPFDLLGSVLVTVAEKARGVMDWFRGLSATSQDLVVGLGTLTTGLTGFGGVALTTTALVATIAEKFVTLQKVLQEVPKAALIAKLGLIGLSAAVVYFTGMKIWDWYKQGQALDKERDSAGGSRTGVLREASSRLSDARKGGWTNVTGWHMGDPADKEIQEAASAVGVPKRGDLSEVYNLPANSPLLAKVAAELSRRMVASNSNLVEHGGYSQFGRFVLSSSMSERLKQLPPNVLRLLQSGATRGQHARDALSGKTHVTGDALDVSIRNWTPEQRDTVMEALDKVEGLAGIYRTTGKFASSQHLHIASQGGSSNYDQVMHQKQKAPEKASQAAEDADRRKKGLDLLRESEIAGIKKEIDRQIAERRKAADDRIAEIKASALTEAEQARAIRGQEAAYAREVAKLRSDAHKHEVAAALAKVRAAKAKVAAALAGNRQAAEAQAAGSEGRLQDVETRLQGAGVPREFRNRMLGGLRLRLLQALGESQNIGSYSGPRWAQWLLRNRAAAGEVVADDQERRSGEFLQMDRGAQEAETQRANASLRARDSIADALYKAATDAIDNAEGQAESASEPAQQRSALQRALAACQQALAVIRDPERARRIQERMTRIRARLAEVSQVLYPGQSEADFQAAQGLEAPASGEESRRSGLQYQQRLAVLNAEFPERMKRVREQISASLDTPWVRERRETRDRISQQLFEKPYGELEGKDKREAVDEQVKKALDPLAEFHDKTLLLADSFERLKQLFDSGHKSFTAVLSSLMGIASSISQILGNGGLGKSLGLFGGIIGGIGSIFGFDDAASDSQARRWGFDAGRSWLQGAADAREMLVGPQLATAMAGGGGTVINAPMHFYGPISRQVDLEEAQRAEVSHLQRVLRTRPTR